MSTESEAPIRKLNGIPARFVWGLAVGLSLYSLLWVVTIVEAQVYRTSFLLVGLVLTFLLYPFRRQHHEIRLVDWAMIGLTLVAFAWPLFDFQKFVYRAAEPERMDLIGGTLAVLIVLEATRRTVGWILPVSAMAFILYGYFGPFLDRIGLSLFAHRGYALDRLVGSLYMTLEGIFGVPLDVAATYIVLFGIYGAVLQYSGAGTFFVDWAMAAMGRSGSRAGAGRSVTLAGFLLGTVSGSGVATTVTSATPNLPVI